MRSKNMVRTFECGGVVQNPGLMIRYWGNVNVVPIVSSDRDEDSIALFSHALLHFAKVVKQRFGVCDGIEHDQGSGSSGSVGEEFERISPRFDRAMTATVGHFSGFDVKVFPIVAQGGEGQDCEHSVSNGLHDQGSGSSVVSVTEVIIVDSGDKVNRAVPLFSRFSWDRWKWWR